MLITRFDSQKPFSEEDVCEHCKDGKKMDKFLVTIRVPGGELEKSLHTLTLGKGVKPILM